MESKQSSSEQEEIAIFDQAVVNKRGHYWQFRMWLPKEGKYARISLRTTNKTPRLIKAGKPILKY
jgi:hypothetical protein